MEWLTVQGTQDQYVETAFARLWVQATWPNYRYSIANLRGVTVKEGPYPVGKRKDAKRLCLHLYRELLEAELAAFGA